MRLLAAFGALDPGRLEALLLPGPGLAGASRPVVTRRVLRRLRARRLVMSSDRLPGNPTQFAARRVYVLSAAGRRAYAALDADFPARRLRPASGLLLNHALVLADIAIAFRAAVAKEPGADAPEWRCDWQVVARLGSTAVIPDALATCILGGQRLYAFVEADRATERTEAFLRKVARYLELYRIGTWREALPVWPAILTVTTSAAHASRLAQVVGSALARLGEPHHAARFRFAAQGEVCGPAGLFSPIWHVAGRAGTSRPVDAAELWAAGDDGDAR